MIKKIEVKRFTLNSSKPFDQVVAALNSAVGHPDMAEFQRSTHATRSAAEMESVVLKALGKTGLMLFMALDQGAVVSKGTGLNTPRIVRLLIGNPLIMRQMAKHVPDAGSYAPVTVLVDERADGVHLSYDRMASFLAPYENAEALKVARDLDAKVEALLASAAAYQIFRTTPTAFPNHLVVLETRATSSSNREISSFKIGDLFDFL